MKKYLGYFLILLVVVYYISIVILLINTIFYNFEMNNKFLTLFFLLGMLFNSGITIDFDKKKCN